MKTTQNETKNVRIVFLFVIAVSLLAIVSGCVDGMHQPFAPNKQYQTAYSTPQQTQDLASLLPGYYIDAETSKTIVYSLEIHPNLTATFDTENVDPNAGAVEAIFTPTYNGYVQVTSENSFQFVCSTDATGNFVGTMPNRNIITTGRIVLRRTQR